VSPIQVVLLTFGVALLYLACAKLGLALAVRAAEVSAVWPPTGFALAAAVLWGRRAVPGILLGAFAANAAAGEPLWVAAGIATGNTIEAVVGASLLARWRFDASLARVRDVISLLAAVAIAPCVSATLGVTFLIAGGLHPASAAPALWLVWWIGDALAALIITPLILVWSRGRYPQPRGFLEKTLMLIGVIVAAGIVFSLPPSFPAAYMVYPFLIWAALRLGPAYATAASLLVNAIAVAGTLLGHGPFAGSGPERGLVLVQCFMAVGATTALILAAIAAESRSAHVRADRSEQRLRMAMAGARVGVWEWNVATGEIVWSEALEPLHGLPQGGFAGTYEAYRKTIHPDDVERVEALIAQSLETRKPYEAEFRLLGPDGVLRWTSARAIVVEDAEGRPSSMVGVGVDVTHLKELEEELRLQHRRKDEFLAMLGHELRNPLAAIVHGAELLSASDPAEIEQARIAIRRQTRTMSRLIDELLDISRISRGQITLERRRLRLSEIVSAGVDVWRHLIAQKNQRLVKEAAKETIWVDGDPTRLTQVISNVVHNAAKFTPAGGTITITTARDDGQAIVAVRDNGQGMAPEVLAHAFELFVQGPPALDRQQGGLGLGLTLVRRLVEMHGGSVEAKSEGPGRGSEVIVRLPLSGPAEPAGADSIKPAAPARRRRVLVVEDNADARDMLVLLLKRSGHDVQAAGDGVAAIAAAQSFLPEIVLLDIGLPGLDGYGVARQLRSSPDTSGAFLVALTGYGQDEDREKALDSGFDHLLLKPAEPAAVLELMTRQRDGQTVRNRSYEPDP
jgi:two-component system CheB/CheR fusion protein